MRTTPMRLGHVPDDRDVRACIWARSRRSRQQKISEILLTPQSESSKHRNASNRLYSCWQRSFNARAARNQEMAMTTAVVTQARRPLLRALLFYPHTGISGPPPGRPARHTWQLKNVGLVHPKNRWKPGFLS
eukprot:IDg3030t1